MEDARLEQMDKNVFQEGIYKGGKTKRNLQEKTDDNCPLPELYVAYASDLLTNPSTFSIADIKLRQSDRMQFVTGTYMKYDGWYFGNQGGQCFIAKITARGDIEDAVYVKNYQVNGDYWVDEQECKAIALAPKTDNVVVVGSWSNGTLWRSMLVTATADLKVGTVRYWYTGEDVYDQGRGHHLGQDVAVAEGDGSIYVTGHLEKSHARKRDSMDDCFVLKLDADLNMIYAKSFGFETSQAYDNLVCSSIQLTRNADYIFLGGILDNGLFFAKGSSNLNTIIMTQLTPDTSKPSQAGESLSMKRILLEQNVTLSSNPVLYFCGFTNKNSGDILFGKVTSSGLNSINVNITFQYGSTSTENVGLGDCKLTEDNKYLIGLMTTNHQVERTFDDITYLITPNFTDSSEDAYDPPVGLSANCQFNSITSYQNYFNNGGFAASCETGLETAINNFIQSYEDKIYSWRTCNDYRYQMHKAKCEIDWITFPAARCNGGSRYIDAFNSCNEDCSPTTLTNYFKNLFNDKKYWYPNWNLGPRCPDISFYGNTWERIFKKSSGLGYTDTVLPGQSNHRGYMFCKDSPNIGCGVENDEVEFVFEQDCISDIKATPQIAFQNWFIFRVPTSNISDAGVDIIPEFAVNFGDTAGDVRGEALAVDQYGFIYVHGQSNSPTFGVTNSNTYTWLHAKTHWEMTYEVQCDYNSVSPNSLCQDSDWLGLRFKMPLKFKNNPGPGPTFVKIYYSPLLSAATILGQVSYPFVNPSYEVREETILLSYQYTLNFHTSVLKRQVKWGMGNVGLNSLFQDIMFYKADTYKGYPINNLYRHSVTLNTGCVQNQYSYGGYNLQDEREKYLQKEFSVTDFPSGLDLQVSATIGTGQYFSLYGNLNSPAVTESHYYFTLRVSTMSLTITQNDPFNCPYKLYGYYWNHKDFSSLRRFETSQRIRFTIDVENTVQPYIASDIPNQSPIVRQLTVISDIRSPNNFRNCDRFYVRRSKQVAVNTLDNYILPKWITFHEQNGTFTMYPPDTTAIVTIEVQCCNNIGQCAYSEFLITPITNPPINALQGQVQTYIVQYDSDPNNTNVGQHFTWGMNKTQFYDVDRATNDPLDVAYKKTDQKVSLEFTNQASYPSDTYRQVMQFGLMFWQGFSSNLGLNSLTYKFHDYDSSTVGAPQTGEIRVLVNQKPYWTYAGLHTSLPDIVDPCQQGTSTYFDQYLPFLKNDDKTDFTVQTKAWFAQGDTDPLKCSMSLSDTRVHPEWMRYDLDTCILTGEPQLKDASTLLHLKFSALDSQEGSANLFKTLLINCKPKPLVTYKMIQFGLNRKVYFNLSSLAFDEDGDPLTFSLPNQSDLTRLEKYGLSFQDENKAIVGRPVIPGTLGSIKVRATDPHGYYIENFITIKIEDYKPKARYSSKSKIFEDSISITESSLFSFQLPDDIFYDAQTSEALVFFASDDTDKVLPSWLLFHPLTRHFYGLAPAGKQDITIRVHAMNPYTHDSLSFMFTMRVIPNKRPKATQASFPQDFNVTLNEWFEHTLPITLFRDSENNHRYYEIVRTYNELQGTFFNSDNRTIYGIVLAQDGLQVGKNYRMEFAYSDDQGKQAFSYVKIRVVAQKQPERYIALWFVIISTFLASMIYLGYAFHYNHLQKAKTSDKVKHILSAKQRFDRFLDVNITLQTSRDLERAQRIKYQRSQVAKRVLGKQGGIKFLPTPQFQVPSLSFKNILGEESQQFEDMQNQEENDFQDEQLMITAFKNNDEPQPLIRITQDGEADQAEVNNESRITQFIRQHLKQKIEEQIQEEDEEDKGI